MDRFLMHETCRIDNEEGELMSQGGASMRIIDAAQCYALLNHLLSEVEHSSCTGTTKQRNVRESTPRRRKSRLARKQRRKPRGFQRQTGLGDKARRLHPKIDVTTRTDPQTVL